MKNKTGISPQYKNMLLISLAALNAAERAETADAAELLLQTATFLARYAFLLEPASEEADFFKPKNALTGEIHSQNAHVARYRDPKYSMWLSADPALGEYIPAAPVSDEARKHNENLPGMGGVYNYVNFNLYHYAGNNPIKYVDPDGRDIWVASEWIIMCGADFRLLDTGITGMLGWAYVTFTNLSTQESFSQCYDILTLNSIGLNAFVGGSAGVTLYTRYFPDGTSPKTVKNSYEGIFANFTCPQMAPAGGLLNICGFSAGQTFVIGLDPIDGIFTNEPAWVGYNAALSFNAVSLLTGLDVPTYSLSYAIYKLPVDDNGRKTKWTDSAYEMYFIGARRFSNQLTPFDYQRIMEQKMQLPTE